MSIRSGRPRNPGIQFFVVVNARMYTTAVEESR
jgi:hypothetical protein